MDTRDLILPAAVFIGGAVIGRFFGLKPLWRGAMAAMALASASKGAGLIDIADDKPRRQAAPRRKAVTRAVRKRPVHKRSARETE